MHPLKDDTFGTVYTIGKDGMYEPITPIADMKVTDIDTPPRQFVDTHEYTFTLKAGRLCRGAIDWITGRPTMAALRYIRRCKRKKEKKRRRRLKGEQIPE